MQAVRLHGPGPESVELEELDHPQPAAREVLVEVHAAAITRDELDWPQDRLPAIPSHELSGMADGEAVYALTPFDRDGVAAEYAAVPADLLAPRPQTLDDVQSAAVPLPALSAWQGLFDHGGLEEGQRVVIHGAGGGVGHFATQLARWRGAYVIGTASPGRADAVRALGADEVLASARFDDDLDPVDLVFDTAGGDALTRSPAVVREGGRVVTVAEEAPGAVYFIVEPNRDQLVQLTGLIDGGHVRPAIDSVFPLADARAAFERAQAGGKNGKVVLRVAA
jgi:NADPH:quinone reductase-like Zn-dependent oxidoreductase